MSTTTAGSIFRIKVALRHVSPPVWRRIEVPADITLDRLHDVLQVVMDWSDYHLHCFRAGRVTYGLPDPDYPHDVADERGVRLDRVAGEGDTPVYEYDFGDSWEHSLKVEKVVPAEPGVRYPRCTDGRRAVPPEDCGGVGGYQHLLEVLADPGHEEHEEMVEWVGGLFDPEAFDADGINAGLEALGEVDADAIDDEDWLDDIDAEPPGPEPEFTDAQAAELAAFLAAPERPDGTLRYEELAGFLFAIACSPELIPPSEWLPLVFNDHDGRFAGIEEAQLILAAMMALYNRTVYGVNEKRIALPPGIACVRRRRRISPMTRRSACGPADSLPGTHTWRSSGRRTPRSRWTRRSARVRWC